MARGSGFKQKKPPRPQREPIKPATDAPRARMAHSKQEVQHEASKFEYVRDERLRKMCQGMACQKCRGSGADWAHSNQAIHGKGRSIKASDIYVAALCWPCHSEIDQGATMTKQERIDAWQKAYVMTWMTAKFTAMIPPGIKAPPGTVDVLWLSIDEFV